MYGRSGDGDGDGGGFHDDSSMESADSYSDDDDGMANDNNNKNNSNNNSSNNNHNNNNSSQPQMAKRAYWLCRVIREAIYGLKRTTTTTTTTTSHTGQEVELEGEVTIDIWEMTEERCAVKVMSHHQIMEQRGAAEDPYKEVSAMQYLPKYHMANIELQAQQQQAQTHDEHGNGNGNVGTRRIEKKVQ